jgi:hypothetical protein
MARKKLSFVPNNLEGNIIREGWMVTATKRKKERSQQEMEKRKNMEHLRPEKCVD